MTLLAVFAMEPQRVTHEGCLRAEDPPHDHKTDAAYDSRPTDAPSCNLQRANETGKLPLPSLDGPSTCKSKTYPVRAHNNEVFK